MTIKAVFILVFAFQVMLHMTRPLVTLFGADLGAGTLEIGIITATYAFFPLLFAVRAGKIADRVGDRLPIMLGMTAAGIGLTFPFAFSALWAVYVSQIIVGLAHIVLMISLQNALGNAAAKDRRDHDFGLFTMVEALGQFCGPIIGGYVAEYASYRHAFLLAGLCGLSGIVFSRWVPSNSRPKDFGAVSAKTGTLSLLKMPSLRKALASSALVLFSRDIFIAYFPLYATRLEISDAGIGWIVALLSMAMVPVRFFLGQLVSFMGRARLLLVSILLAGICFLLLPLMTNPYLMAGLAICIGAGLGCGQPLSMAIVYDASPAGKTGEVLGLRLAANRLSMLCAPILFGAIGAGLGLAAVFLASGAVLAAGAFYAHGREKPQTGASKTYPVEHNKN